MPDRELPEHLVSRLSSDLVSGAPLRAPLASQARYATAAGPAAVGRFHIGARLAISGLAAVALVAATLAAAPQPRQWLIQSVDNLAGAPSSPTPSPKHPVDQAEPSAPVESTAAPEPSESPEAQESPEPGESPEPRESPEPGQSPEPRESPEPSSSPDSDGGDHGDGGRSPSPETSD